MEFVSPLGSVFNFDCLLDVSGVVIPFFKKSIGKERTITEMNIYTVKTLHRTRLTGAKKNSQALLYSIITSDTCQVR